MVKTITLCSSCNSKIDVEGEPNQEIEKNAQIVIIMLRFY